MEIVFDNDCKCRAKKAPVSFSTHSHGVAAEGPPSQPQLAACGPVVITNLIVTLIVSDSVVDASSQRQLQSRGTAPERHRDHKATETQRCDFDFDFMNQNRLSLEQMSLPSSLRIPRPIQNLLSVGKTENTEPRVAPACAPPTPASLPRKHLPVSRLST